MNYAVSNYSKIVSILINFNTKSTLFQHFMFDSNVIGTVTPLNCWKSQSERVDNWKESKSQIQLLTTFASSAGVERFFSSFGLVHCDLHNRLGISKSGKLVFLYKVLNKNQLEDWFIDCFIGRWWDWHIIEFELRSQNYPLFLKT